MARTKNNADWHVIEGDYRAGIKTIEQIASEHGITEGLVRNKAKRFGWTRDLSEKIQKKADEKLRALEAELRFERSQRNSEQELREVVPRRASPDLEKSVVAANADLHVEIRLNHRKDITRGRGLMDKLMGELAASCDNRDLIAQAAQVLEEGDQEKLAELARKASSMPMRIDGAKKLIEILEKVVRLEREAYGIDGKTESQGAVDDLLRRVHEYKGGE